MELVSGPDVGGGFLFQLTRERTEPLATYTVHAQEGGLDGGERPAGTPADVGFERAPGMCSIGGRRCYHRSYGVPLLEHARVRFAYNRMRFVIGPMLEQRVGRRPARYAEGLDVALPRIAQALGGARIPWMVGGSAGAELRGAAIVPRDLDLVTTAEGVSAVAAGLEEFLIEPPSQTHWSDGVERRAARAFVGTLQDGLRVEWAEAVAPTGEWSRPTMAGAQVVVRKGVEVPVAPVEFCLAKAFQRGDAERWGAILAALPRSQLDPDLVAGLLAGDPVAQARWSSAGAASTESPGRRPSARSLGS